MSFLKQLLTPFVEFEDDAKPGPAKPNPPATAPVATPQPATPSFLPPPLPAVPRMPSIR
ncbi:hypothetical protein [Hymenobacter volaticus]|uniref:Uncharacterized protein n=1 Tax=Hymenobacter volaticus TaxID=2932254 RepID=A0ABY4GE42_9BACT|nr:hypothetical protein [Hymenobacter volaticus]UOQ69071.1 hypothetical protein MUN86_26575 [Hymenobacter volaticus]